MPEDTGTAVHTQELKSKIHSALALIRRLREGCPSGELYEKGVVVYEALLDLIELPEIASKIPSEGGPSIPLDKLENSAHRIVSMLLFNEHNNPLLSLGLPYTASREQIRARWLRLMKIYHPDRYIDKAASEEKAKKINEAYRDAIKIREKTDLFDQYAREEPEDEKIPPHKIHVPRERNRFVTDLRSVPAAIFVSSFLFALVAVFLYMTSPPAGEPVHKLPARGSTRAASPEKQQQARLDTGPVRPDLAPEETSKIKTAPVEDETLPPVKEPPRTFKHHPTSRPHIPARKSVATLKEAPARKAAAVLKKAPTRQTGDVLKEGPSLEESETTAPPEKRGFSTNRRSFTPDLQALSAAAKPRGGSYVVDEINDFIDRFNEYYRNGNNQGFLSLFTEDALEDGKSALDLFSGPEAESYKMKQVQITITGKNTADVSAAYVVDEINNGKTTVREGRISWSMEKMDSDFKITVLRMN
jgi:hypothetical protein